MINLAHPFQSRVIFHHPYYNASQNNVKNEIDLLTLVLTYFSGFECYIFSFIVIPILPLTFFHNDTSQLTQATMCLTLSVPF